MHILSVSQSLSYVTGINAAGVTATQALLCEEAFEDKRGREEAESLTPSPTLVELRARRQHLLQFLSCQRLADSASSHALTETHRQSVSRDKWQQPRDVQTASPVSQPVATESPHSVMPSPSTVASSLQLPLTAPLAALSSSSSAPSSSSSSSSHSLAPSFLRSPLAAMPKDTGICSAHYPSGKTASLIRRWNAHFADEDVDLPRISARKVPKRWDDPIVPNTHDGKPKIPRKMVATVQSAPLAHVPPTKSDIQKAVENADADNAWELFYGSKESKKMVEVSPAFVTPGIVGADTDADWDDGTGVASGATGNTCAGRLELQEELKSLDRLIAYSIGRPGLPLPMSWLEACTLSFPKSKAKLPPKTSLNEYAHKKSQRQHPK